MSTKSDLASFSEGTRFLARRPLVSLGLAALGMVLAALPPFLQIKAGLPDNEIVVFALTFAALFPLEMFFFPRFLAEADAAAGHALNPAGTWSTLFDSRWMKAMAGKFLLYAAVLTGALFLLLPGLLLLFLFGFAPLRILLRGEEIPDAIRGCLRMMAAGWRRVLMVVLAMAILYLGIMLLMGFALGSLAVEPTPWVRMTNPRIWAGNFIGSLLNLWTSATLLALFRRIEAPAEKEPQGPAV